MLLLVRVCFVAEPEEDEEEVLLTTGAAMLKGAYFEAVTVDICSSCCGERFVTDDDGCRKLNIERCDCFISIANEEGKQEYVKMRGGGDLTDLACSDISK